MSSDPRIAQDHPFEGGAFHPRLPGGRASGLVRLSFGGVRFESEKGAFDLPLDLLQLDLGGASDRLVFLTHPGHPEVVVHTADHAILDHPAIAQNAALRLQRDRLRAKKRTAWAVLLAIAAVLVAGIAALFLARDPLVRAAARTVPVEWEVAAGNKLFEQLIASRREIEDPALSAQLAQITGPLVAHLPDRRYPFQFHIVEDPSLNAFALPGGHVVLHTGLLLAAERPEEVAGVLAHEIAHVTHRHGIRNIISSAGLYLALSTLIGDASGVLAVLADNSAFLLDRKFSRDFEREADETGWAHLLRSDLDPQGMIAFFEKMQAGEEKLRANLPAGGAIGSALDFLSTHPGTAERIAALEQKWRELPRKAGFRNIALNYPAFKASLRAQLHASGN